MNVNERQFKRGVMRSGFWLVVGLVLIGGLLLAQQPKDPCARTSAVGYSDTPVIPEQKWKVHDIDRPHPPMLVSRGDTTDATGGGTGGRPQSLLRVACG